MTDAGSAPNTQGGYCSLTICKPRIRLSAKVGDYVIGLRGRSGYIGTIGPHAVDSILYIMRITEKMTYPEYNDWCSRKCKVKIPSLENPIGDCQYDADLQLRIHGPHKEEHIKTDISGIYALVSKEFWYRPETHPAGFRLPSSLATQWNVEKVKRGHTIREITNESISNLLQDIKPIKAVKAAKAGRC